MKRQSSGTPPVGTVRRTAMSDLFLTWLSAVICLLAAMERPDRRAFWLSCLYFCVGASVVCTLIEAAA